MGRRDPTVSSPTPVRCTRCSIDPPLNRCRSAFERSQTRTEDYFDEDTPIVERSKCAHSKFRRRKRSTGVISPTPLRVSPAIQIHQTWPTLRGKTKDHKHDWALSDDDSEEKMISDAEEELKGIVLYKFTKKKAKVQGHRAKGAYYSADDTDEALCNFLFQLDSSDTCYPRGLSPCTEEDDVASPPTHNDLIVEENHLYDSENHLQTIFEEEEEGYLDARTPPSRATNPMIHNREFGLIRPFSANSSYLATISTATTSLASTNDEDTWCVSSIISQDTPGIGDMTKSQFYSENCRPLIRCSSEPVLPY